MTILTELEMSVIVQKVFNPPPPYGPWISNKYANICVYIYNRKFVECIFSEVRIGFF